MTQFIMDNWMAWMALTVVGWSCALCLGVWLPEIRRQYREALEATLTLAGWVGAVLLVAAGIFRFVASLE